MTERERPDRNLALKLVRVTEAAAVAAARWMGRGGEDGADGAAVEAMRHVLDSVGMDSIVVIGEGEKDEAPMLFNGERIGNGTPPMTDIAVDPIDGTTLAAIGRASAIAVIAVTARGAMFNPGPCVYMEKIAVGPEAAGMIDLRWPMRKNLEAIAKAKQRRVADFTVEIPGSGTPCRADLGGSRQRGRSRNEQQWRRRRSLGDRPGPTPGSTYCSVSGAPRRE